ncbi:CRTAC1 family protein [Novipirellula artificiosorum]|uniref:ASPIC and UnbV n=1 Tax=Novipirellula artificiosorum TaxID=2528016 RepID=A0A5C6DEP6_9BACT|nr:CRTAC1 family protein [Novipirellula artificiosorum]TWU34404.1 ASPIC and UnbV [Novipirellula artificiosorum]
MSARFRLILVAALLFSGCNKRNPDTPSGGSSGAGSTGLNEHHVPADAGQAPNLSDLIRSPQPESSLDGEASAIEPEASPFQFENIAAEAGVQHVYENGATGDLMMSEGFGGGVGALDYDLDGNWDLFFSQGGDATKPAGPSQPSVGLFRNQSQLAFRNTTKQAGFGRYDYGQGVAVGDYNDDGFDDLYLTCIGPNVLLENMGDGTFRDVTVATETVDGSQWSTSAAFADVTGDGLLDLYVCNYLEYDPKHPLDCRDSSGARRICQPRETPPMQDACFINLGNGTFRDEVAERGLIADGSKSLGVAVADFNVDGKPDIYVANDTTANFLFMNLGDSTFQDRALLNGCAVNYEGLYQAGMGLGIGDYDGDGLQDIYVTHYYDESNTLYRNIGPAGFQDVTSHLGLHTPTVQLLGFGVVMDDLDQDGLQDMFFTNGHVEYFLENPLLKMPPAAFQFDGKRWHDRSRGSGSFFSEKHVGRGVASIDLDNDGDTDFAVVHQNEPAAVLRNDSQRGHWLKVSLIGHASPRRGIGAQVSVTAGDRVLVEQMVGGSSYQSTHQPMLLFGLGDFSGHCDIEIRWPSGEVQTIEGVGIDQEHVIEEGFGRIDES